MEDYDLIFNFTDIDSTLLLQNTTAYEGNEFEELGNSNPIIPIRFTITVICFLVGLIGNGFTLYIIPAYPDSRTVTNCLLWNLAFADILFLSISPNVLTVMIARSWIFPDFMCSIFYGILQLKPVISCLILSLLAMERLTILHCQQIQIKPLLWTISTLVVWTIAIAFTIPSMIHTEVDKINEKHSFCREKWPSYHFHTYYAVVLFAIFGFPLWINFVVLIVAAIRLRRNTLTRVQLISEKIALCLALISFHIISWSLFYVVRGLGEFFINDNIENFRTWAATLFLIECLLEVNSAVPPLLILWLTDDLKRKLINLVGIRPKGSGIEMQQLHNEL